MTAIQIGTWKLYKTVQYEGVMFHTIQVTNITIITLYTSRLNSVFTTDTCFSYMLPLMFFIFDVQEE